MIWLTLALVSLNASAATIDPASLPPGWALHDPLPEDFSRAADGAVASLTNGDATVFVYRAPPRPKPGPANAKAWAGYLFGPTPHVDLEKPTLEARDGQRRIRLELQADGATNVQVYTALLAVETKAGRGARLTVLRFETTAASYHEGIASVRQLFQKARLAPERRIAGALPRG